MLCGSLDGRGVWGRMDYMYMAEALCWTPETSIPQYKTRSVKFGRKMIYSRTAESREVCIDLYACLYK